MNNKIRKLQLGDYFLWNNLSREDKVKRNKQIALLYLDKGPSILNYYNALKAYFGGFNPKNPYLLTGEPTILPGMGSSVANVVAKEYLLNSGLKAIKSTDYLIKGIQGTFPKANLSNILNKYNNEILNNGILSEFKNTGRFKNIMNEILLEIEKVYGKLGSDAFNIIKTNPEGLPYRLGLEWILKYNFKKGGSLKSANARKWKHKDGGLLFIFLEGGKTSWWNKAINFVNNSGLGEVALNALSTYTLNKLIGADSDIAKALVDKDKAFRILQANLAAELEARNIQLSNISPENPNAMGGDIVKNFIKNKLLSLKMALINLESNLEKAEIDWQTLLLKNLNTMNTLSGIGNVLMQGLGHVGLYMGNKLLTNVNNT